MQKVRETALELQALGFNVHQALALLKREWQSKIADECAAGAPSAGGPVKPAVETPQQPT